MTAPCKETGCPHSVDIPCADTSLLFGLKVYLENMLNRLGEADELKSDTKEQLEAVDAQLKSLSLHQQEIHYNEFKESKKTAQADLTASKPPAYKTTQKKQFYLVCTLGHRYFYEAECPK